MVTTAGLVIFEKGLKLVLLWALVLGQAGAQVLAFTQAATMAEQKAIALGL